MDEYLKVFGAGANRSVSEYLKNGIFDRLITKINEIEKEIERLQSLVDIKYVLVVKKKQKTSQK